ncbi:MAG: MAPEG family protein [Leptolyngbya sp. SIO3F4]|nr:MAPEG family protein [Leptolyngbya sp. SIO3F4]
MASALLIIGSRRPINQLASWGCILSIYERMTHAHSNAVENLVIFAPLALALAIAGISTPATIAACQLYFFARLAHYVIYTLGVPFARTVAFLVGVVAQIILAVALLGAVA